MKVVLSQSVLEDHPKINELLWATAVAAKEEDPDIHLMGLRVQVRRSCKKTFWSGHAWPCEHTTTSTGKVHVHPAGKITMSVGCDCSEQDIVQLFAHELRHIGQFHRGRYEYGYLTCDWVDYDVEQDCYDFEDIILYKFSGAATNGCEVRYVFPYTS